MPGVLLPLWVVLMMLGSNLGLTDEQTADKYVYYSTVESQWAYADGGAVIPSETGGESWLGRACRDEYTLGDCEGLPANRTFILYPAVWQVYGLTHPEMAYVIRHEVEHLLQADPTDEAGAHVAGCGAYTYFGWVCQ